MKHEKGINLEHKHKCDFVHLHCEERDRCIETLETIEDFESLETLDTIEDMKGFETLETMKTVWKPQKPCGNRGNYMETL